MNGAQIVVEVLKKEGVEYIFGYPGGACMPIFDALVDAPELKFILIRNIIISINYPSLIISLDYVHLTQYFDIVVYVQQSICTIHVYDPLF